jgi:predicted RNA-binding protein with PUA-like domain
MAKAGANSEAKTEEKSRAKSSAAPQYWLLKSEPECFSFEDLWKAPRRRTGWDGVRNYQARNFMRDAMRVGDGVLYYHSSAEPPGIAGIARVASAAYPDPTQFDPAAEHFDPKSKREAPQWFQVDIEAVKKLPRFVALEDLKSVSGVAGMLVLQRGQRLSVMPVSAKEWGIVLELAGLTVRDF